MIDAGKMLITDQHLADPTAEEELGYPYSDSKPYQRVIGTLFQREVMMQDYIDAYRRYPLARRVVDMPIEESFDNGFILIDDKGDPIPSEQNTQAMLLYNRDRSKLNRFCKLVQLFGHSETVFGYTDKRSLWMKKVEEGVKFKWIQPVPLPNEQELKITEQIPIEILSVTTNFGGNSDVFHPSRLIHAMNPKLIEEDKDGESAILPIYNALDVQVHADWSIGQTLWRNAGGLLGLFAPKKKQSAQEKIDAIKSVANHNAKTVLYIPNGWAVKEVLKSRGNIAIQRTYATILNQIAAGTGIPVSILVGSQFRDPSEQDTRTYFRTVSTKQNNLISPILKKYFRKGQKAKSIDPGPIDIKWNPLEYKSQVDKKVEELQLQVLNVLQERIEKKEDIKDLSNLLVKSFRRK